MQPTPRSAYRKLNPDPTEQELTGIFTPTKHEIELSLQWARQPLPRLGGLLYFKLFQHLGYFPTFDQIRAVMVKHLADSSGIRRYKLSELKAHSESGTAKRHRKRILEYIGVTPYSVKMDGWLKNLAKEAATTKHSNDDIVNVLLEDLIRQKTELPNYKKLYGLAVVARQQVNDRCYDSIIVELSSEAKRRIDELLTMDDHQIYTQWNNLKKEPRKPTNKIIREYLHHVHWLRSQNEIMPKISLPPMKY